LTGTIQTIPHPLSGPSVKSISLQFRDKDIVWNSVHVHTYSIYESAEGKRDGDDSGKTELWKSEKKT